jgi:chromosome segregation ATPase
MPGVQNKAGWPPGQNGWVCSGRQTEGFCMIESAMYFSMGFFLASLGALAVVSLVHGRAVRLTTRRLEAKIPSSMAEILADKDLLRAEFATSTRRLETSIEQLRAESASQLAELGRKSDAVNRIKIELHALRDKVGPTEEEFAVKTDAVRAAERAMSAKELQLANVMEELNERSTLADVQKIEIIALKTQVEALKARLDSELKAAERRADVERALSEKESQLAKLMDELNDRSTFADAQKIEINALKTESEALKERLDEASNELKAAEERRPDLECALSEKESQLTKLMDELNERSTLADAQKIEINALKTEIEELKGRLEVASNELKAVEEHRNSERLKLKATNDRLMDERGKFEDFHRRVEKLAQQLMAQSAQDKMLGRRAEELEKRLLEQSQLLNERELELTHLRGEFEIARKAEADLRVALIKVDSRENIATQKLETENAKLKAALDRANSERVRLTYELANKNRQAEDPWAAGRNVGTEGTQRVAYGRLRRRTNLGPVRLVKSHEDRGVR